MKYIKLALIFLVILCMNIRAYSEAPVDITKMNIYEINEAIDKGYLSYELLIRLYFDRIEAYDKNYKAIISVNKGAIEEAKKCDIEFKKSGRTNALWCMPLIVKDNIDVKGLATTVGSKALSDSYPNEDAYVIKKLKEKGMIVLAKANMSAFAFAANSSVSYYGMVHNAYNLSYSPYGSSGGSAVAVAVQYAPFALGTDTNASLRAPVSANNVVGFRPTLDLIDTKGIVAYDITRDVVGPIAKNTSENALLMSAITGDNYNLDSNDLTGKNIAVLDQFVYNSSTYGEIKTLFDDAIKKMEDAGAKIIHLKDFYTYSYALVEEQTLGGWTMCYAFNKYIKNTSSKIKSFYELANSSANTYSLWDNYNKCDISISTIDTMENKKTTFRKAINDIFKKYDLDAIVYPNSQNKLLKLDETNSSINSHKIAPVLGLPAISVPLGFDSEGLPYGIEFVGLKNTEEKLYQVANSYEKLNKNYELPSIAPSLYTVPESVVELKEIYEASQNSKIFGSDSKDKIKEIKDFFTNYNDVDDKKDKASKLYSEYISILKSKNMVYDKDKKTITYSISYEKLIFYFILILFLLRVLKSLFGHKKRRKH